MIKRLRFSLILAELALVLAGCGNPTPSETPVPIPTATAIRVAATPTQPPGPSPAKQTTVAAAARTTERATTVAATVAQGEADLTAVKPERAVVRSFTDAQGRAIKLTYGRGSGHGGDYGWAHILGKHINGIWYDGGTITTFPKAVGAKTPAEVVDLIGRSLQDKKPDDQSGGRRGYVYVVAGTNSDVFTVTGNDGTIITSYPVKHGSKDEDA